ncbi:MAG TPA: ferritin family protein [Candidatus Deferrimicrobiaceae bacterium]|jgi:rubrerythrin
MKPTPLVKAVGPGLRTALMNEIDGREFYRMAAQNAGSAGVREMFEFLMAEEDQHYQALVAQAGRLADGKPLRFKRSASGRKKLGEFRGGLVSPGMVADSRKAEGEIAALSIGMTLEQRAMRQFAALRKKAEAAGDEAAVSVFSGLVAWEKDHLDLLESRYNALREAYWEEARFWPF